MPSDVRSGGVSDLVGPVADKATGSLDEADGYCLSFVVVRVLAVEAHVVVVFVHVDSQTELEADAVIHHGERARVIFKRILDIHQAMARGKVPRRRSLSRPAPD